MKLARRIFLGLVLIGPILVAIYYLGIWTGNAFGCMVHPAYADICEVGSTDIGEILWYMAAYGYYGFYLLFFSVAVAVIWGITEFFARK